MCKVILYCRVSTDEQSEGCSLEMQERFLRAYCLNRGDDVVDVYREDYSAKGHELNRPEFKKVYDYCGQGAISPLGPILSECRVCLRI